MKLLLALWAIVSFATTPAETYSPRPFPPVDAAQKDASFLKFRKQLLRIVRARDTEGLITVLDPKIKFSFGAETDGPAAFRKEFGLSGPKAKASEVWQQLEQVLTHGGSWQEKTFAAPYVFSDWPSEFEAFEYTAGLDKNIAVRSEPRKNARIVARVGQEILALEGNQEKSRWTKVRTPDGIVGYVSAASVHSPVGYRAFFKKKNGEWRMTLFIAGD